MQVFGTDHGGKAELEKIDTWLAELQDNIRTNELRKHAKRHHGQQLRLPPLLPVHHFVFDPMHGMHNEANVILDESVHKHLMVESKEPEVKKTIEEAQAKINARWKAANLPKFIQFGRDGQGAHGHAMNGPTVEYVMDHPELVIDTIKDMEPVYQLLEARKQTPPLQPDAVGEGADAGPGRGGKKGKWQQQARTAPQKHKKRRVIWGDEGDAQQGGGGAASTE